MIKDPFHKEETPYDILNLAPNATPNEVQEALPRYLRIPENRSKLQIGIDAASRLRNPKERIRIDLLYYWIEPNETEDEAIPILKNDINKFLVVPTFSIDEVFNDLEKEDFSLDYKEIKYKKEALTELEKYDNIQDIRVEILFDR